MYDNLDWRDDEKNKYSYKKVLPIPISYYLC